MALLVTLAATGFLGTFLRYNEAQTILREGKALVVEGQIENFEASNKAESFSVAGIPFKYTVGGQGSPGFTRLSMDGGPLRAGLYIRIHYANLNGYNTILQLELKE